MDHVIIHLKAFKYFWASQFAILVKKLPANAGDIRNPGSIPGQGRPAGGGHGTTSGYFFLFLPNLPTLLNIIFIHYMDSLTILTYVFSCCSVAKLYMTLCDPMDYSTLGFPVHRIIQARIQEWLAILFSRGSSQPRDRIWVSCIPGRFFTI